MKQTEFQPRRSQTDCQTHLFAVITARQQDRSFPCCVSTKAGVQDSRKGFLLLLVVVVVVCVCVCVCVCLNYTTLFFSPLKESNSSRPSPSSQLKGTESALSFLFSIHNH